MVARINLTKGTHRGLAVEILPALPAINPVGQGRSSGIIDWAVNL